MKPPGQVLVLAGLAVLLMTPHPSANSPLISFPEFASQPAMPTVYYVRMDGGSAEQCTGLVNAPYPGSGTGQPCAWNHPFHALPPGGVPRIAGGDTLLIGPGDYRMGFGSPGSEPFCDFGGSYECVMSPIPSGPSPDRPTRILGEGWDVGCPSPPQLWGSGRPWFIMNLTDSSNVEVACLEITDRSECVEFHTGGLACERDNPPYGDWASYGLYAEDSANVHLWHLDIHGLAAGGVHAGRLTDWTVDDVHIAGNGSVGWDGDLWDDLGDSNSGTLLFRRWVVAWNGCGETLLLREPIGCWAQEAGGYGDGVGTGETGGTWIIEDSAFLYNTSDGLDLLYHTLGGSVMLSRVHAEGNAGNQIKVAGQTTIVNSLLVGNCAFFADRPFTYLVDHCRAMGNSLELAFTGGEQVSVLNTTIYGQGDGLIGAGPREGFTCDGSEHVRVRNSILVGDAEFIDPSDITFLFYQEGCGSLKLESDYNIAYSVKNITCGQQDDYTISGSHDLCQDPRLTGPLAGSTFWGMTLLPDSPGIDTGDNAECPFYDLPGNSRPADGDLDGDAVCDRGAYEHSQP